MIFFKLISSKNSLLKKLLSCSWTSFGKQKLNSYEFKQLDSDNVYQLKVKTYSTDAAGNETAAEIEPVTFVAYYKKGTIGASVLTENSITMEWGNLLPYDEVELTIPECDLFEDANYSYKNEQSPITVKEGNIYSFTNLKSEQGYAIQCLLFFTEFTKYN